MMRFHCPNCQQILEVDQLVSTLLCPACELWCRIPLPSEFELNREEVRELHPPRTELPYEPTLAPSEPIPVLRSEGLFSPPSEDVPLRFREEPDEVEKVEFEEVAEPRPRRRRRRRRRSRGSFHLDYWISSPLILLLLLLPGGLLLVGFSFCLHPGAGFGAFLMVGGGMWFTLIAAEDGMRTALLVIFVPFYAWYFAFLNFERVVLPFLIHSIGTLIFLASLIVAGLHAAEDSSILPVPAEPITCCPARCAAAGVFRPL